MWVLLVRKWKEECGVLSPMFCFLFFGFFFGRPATYGVPGLRIRSQPQLQPKRQLQQQWIPNPLCRAGDRTFVPVLSRCCWSRCATAGTPVPCASFMTWVHSFCENSLTCTFMICALLCLIILQLPKKVHVASRKS